MIRIIICRVQNPDLPRAGRYGAAHCGTAGPGGDEQHRTPTGRFHQEKNAPLTLQTMEKITSWACLRRHEQRKSYVNR